MIPSPIKSLLGLMTIFLVTNCGVEAGNPDSTEEKPAKFSLKLTDTPVTGLSHFYIDAISIKVGANPSITFDEVTTIDVLTLNNGKTLSILDEKEITAGAISEITLTLADTTEPVRAVSSAGVNQKVIVLKDEKATTSLTFTGDLTLTADQAVTAIVDVDLRYTLATLDANSRSKYGVADDVIYALNHKHTFFTEGSRGTMSFTGKQNGELICVTTYDKYTAANLPKTCIPDGADIVKGVYADSNGTATVISIPTGQYNVWGIIGDQVTQYGSRTVASDTEASAD